MLKSYIAVVLLISYTALAFPKHGINVKIGADTSSSNLVSQLQSLVSSSSSGSSNLLSLLTGSNSNGLSLSQILQLAQQLQSLQQSVSSVSSGSSSAASSALNITSDLLNVVNILRSPNTNKSNQFQTDLNSLISQYITDQQSRNSLISLVQQIKNNGTATVVQASNLVMNQSIPNSFYTSLHSLVSKYMQ